MSANSIDPYKKIALNAILQEFTAYFVKWGFNERLAQIACNKMNAILGENRFTADDLRSLMARIKTIVREEEIRDAYYGSDKPRTSKLVLRDKVFFARSKAISEFLK